MKENDKYSENSPREKFMVLCCGRIQCSLHAISGNRSERKFELHHVLGPHCHHVDACYGLTRGRKILSTLFKLQPEIYTVGEGQGRGGGVVHGLGWE